MARGLDDLKALSPIILAVQKACTQMSGAVARTYINAKGKMVTALMGHGASNMTPLPQAQREKREWLGIAMNGLVKH